MRWFRKQDQDRQNWELLRKVVEAEPIPSEGHVAEDEQMLTCWSMGLLSAEEEGEFYRHLAICRRCRGELRELVARGVVTPPEGRETEPDGVVEGPEAAVASASRRSVAARVFWVLGPLAVAASLLVAIYGGYLGWGRSAGSWKAVLVEVRQELWEDRPGEAWRRLEALVGQRPELLERPEVGQLVVETAEVLARQELAAKDFHQVLELEAKVREWLGPTAGLVNLKIQAERGMKVELALQEAGTLLAYAYEPDGRSLSMALPTIDATTERLDQEFQEACQRFPEQTSLWLNRGQFLLSIARPVQAKECFRRASQLEPSNPLVWIGMGLAAFEEGAVEEALGQFRRAVDLAPENTAARLNMAICLYRLGRTAQALEQFQQVLGQSQDQQLRERLEAAIPELRGGGGT
ncbi:MAG TPA: tetratricopeptide repeat protein [Thermoguttaceae bacterium]|nr:tetratricopeptide repeat protein [Thermoguttaceae bacterium]